MLRNAAHVPERLLSPTLVCDLKAGHHEGKFHELHTPLRQAHDRIELLEDVSRQQTGPVVVGTEGEAQTVDQQ